MSDIDGGSPATSHAEEERIDLGVFGGRELGEFESVANEIIESFVRTVEAKRPPPTIFHYTDNVGLRGILESGKLWFTDIFNLNDPSELSHGFSHAVDLLQSKAIAGPSETRIFAEQFAAFGQQGGIAASAHYFVCSFSANGDELGQWRAYADNGRGYALAFDTLVLEKAFTQDEGAQSRNNSTFPVSYQESELIGLHREMVERVFPLISLPRGKGWKRDAIMAFMRELSISLTLSALHAVVFFKHEAYRNEQEYRFLQTFRADQPAPDTKFRSRRYSLARYREFDWRMVAKDALKGVVVGPAADPERANQFARDCLRAFHSENAAISSSKVPYRVT